MLFKDLPDKEYKMIMADPPWAYRDRVRSKGKGGAASHYQCISHADLEKFPMADLAEEDSVLLLWTTFPQYPFACSCIGGWGFDYKTALWVWVKTTKTGKLAMGLGHYSRANAEVCLLGVRGKGLPVLRHDILNVQMHRRLEHSEKPQLFHDLSVEIFGNVPRIDLFARKMTPGWDGWGLELEEGRYEQ